MQVKKRIGDMIMEAKLATDFQVAVALGRAKTWGTKVGEELIRLGFVSEEALTGMLEQQLGIKWVRLKNYPIEPNIIALLKNDVVEKHKVIPIAVEGKTLTLATSDPMDYNVISALEFLLNKRIITVIATPSDVRWAMNKYYTDIDVSDRIMETASGDTNLDDMVPDNLRSIYISTITEVLIDTLDNKGIIKKNAVFLEVDRRMARKSKSMEVMDGPTP